MKTALLLLCAYCLLATAQAQRVLAFPGAQGFGAYASGGRGGRVIYVTNLNAAGPGSFQWALDQTGKKYVLFKVSGVIPAQIHLHRGDVTIAGQTSPGGITVRGFVTDEQPFQDQEVRRPTTFAENWILRCLRTRPGLTGLSDDGLRLRYTRNAIVDRVSVGNAIDEAVEISFSNRLTIQNCILAETLGEHSIYGGMLINYSNPAFGFQLTSLSIVGNLWSRLEGRFPEFSRESPAAARSNLQAEVSSNLYWDAGYFMVFAPDLGAAGTAPIAYQLNLVNNRSMVRPGFPYGMFEDTVLRQPASFAANNRLYVKRNLMNLYGSGRSDYGLFYCCNDFPTGGPDVSPVLAQRLSTRNAFPGVNYPEDVVKYVRLNAGAFPRDPMDRRLLGYITSSRTNTGTRNANPANDAAKVSWTGTPPVAPRDTDRDGMPDDWERAKGLNPTVQDHNGYRLSTTYPNIEIYLNDLIASKVTGL